MFIIIIFIIAIMIYMRSTFCKNKMKTLHQKKIRNILIGRQGSQSSQRKALYVSLGRGFYEPVSQAHCSSAFLTAEVEFLWDFT